MTVKELIDRLLVFEEEGLTGAGICIESEDGRLEGAEGVEVNWGGALAVVVLLKERKG